MSLIVPKTKCYLSYIAIAGYLFGERKLTDLRPSTCSFLVENRC